MMFYYYNTSLLSFSILRYLICLRQSRAMAKKIIIFPCHRHIFHHISPPRKPLNFYSMRIKNPENEHTEYQITSKTTF